MEHQLKNRPISETDRIRAALIAVFSTTKDFVKFAETKENSRTLRSLMSLAAKKKLIPTDSFEAFLDFIHRNSNLDRTFLLPRRLNFERFLAQKDKLLGIDISVRILVDDANKLLDRYDIALPKVTNTMLSRLKKEPANTLHKQSVLRSLAFWIGYHRSFLVSKWNIESLLTVCRRVVLPLNSSYGVRVGFVLSGRGEVIDNEILTWLKNKVNTYIHHRRDNIAYGGWGKIREKDISNLYVDFPKEDSLQNPTTYRQCLRSAISLAHQIAIQWALTPFYGQNRFLSIGIATGDFDSLGQHLSTILNIKLPGDPVIRLTDFSRQCAQINDIRATYCSQPKEVSLLSGETLNIWWITGVWTPLYFDFVPELLADPILKGGKHAVKSFYNYYYGIFDDTEKWLEDLPNAVLTFLGFPHNVLLGLEIAKTLYYRRLFWEAIHIMRVVLSLDPAQIQARAFLIKIYSNLALEAPTEAIAEGFFDEASDEANYILENCDRPSEDFYCEYALLHLTKALTALRYLREQTEELYDSRKFIWKKEIIFENLKKADKLFQRGTLVSPLSIRASYLRNGPKIVMHALKANESIFTDPELFIDGRPEVIKEVITNYQWQTGSMRKEMLQSSQYTILNRLFESYIQNHDNAISLWAYRATTSFCAAVVWWDLFPIRTVGVAKKAIGYLERALEIAEEMDQRDICIYSFTRVYGEMLPAKEFLAHIRRSIKMIKSYCGRDLGEKRDKDLLSPKDPSRMSLLMTLNF